MMASRKDAKALRLIKKLQDKNFFFAIFAALRATQF